jgi:peroxiredoxin Q/BCP
VDAAPSNKRFAEELGLTFPLLSDFSREVSTRYGILNTQRNFAIRTTYVVDKNGIVRLVQQGNDAINPNAAVTECERIHKAG